MDIQNCAAFVTGGASGMGAATARRLAKLGAKVAVIDMNLDAAKVVASEIGGIAIYCDVSKDESVTLALNEVEKHYGAPRICVNCAGIVYARKMVNKAGVIPLDDFRRVIDINLIGTFNVMRLVAQRMMTLSPIGSSAERGIIINTASVAAYEGQIGQTAYSASKGAIVSMTLPAARELADDGIRVMTIAPGLIDTPMFDKIPAEARASLAAMVPFPKRLGLPEEYAMLATHIVENPLLNGEVIRLDGALRMQAK